MDWSSVWENAWQVLAGGGVGALLANWLNRRATARQAELDRAARAQVSRRDRTYADTRKAFMDALALLIRLDQARVSDDSEDPSETFADAATLSEVEATLAVYASADAARTFRSAADHYCWSWRDDRATERLDLSERAFFQEHVKDGELSGVYETTREDMRQARYLSARKSADAYRSAERERADLTRMAWEQLGEADD